MAVLTLFGGQVRESRSAGRAGHRPAFSAGPEVGAAGLVGGPARCLGRAHDARAVDGDHVAELWVNTGAVQAFVVILPEHLPVAGKDTFVAMTGHKRLHGPVVQGAKSDIGIERAGPRREIEEDKAVPDQMRYWL